MGGSTEDVARAVALIPGAGDVAVAYSGGVDSTVLLHAVAKRFPASRLRALHVNHGLRPEARDWQRHCERVAGDLGVAIEVLCVTVEAGNMEARARRARYAAWRNALRASERLLLAHHANDQAETVLWRLLTGRTPVGMPRERSLGAGFLVRPFLHLRRTQLIDYAKAQHLAWVEDPTNADIGRDRSYIRHEIMPRLEARCPSVVAALSAHGPDMLPATRESLPITGLTAEKVRAWLGVGVSDRRVDEMLRQARAAADANPVIRLPGGDSVRRYRDHLYRVPNLSPPASEYGPIEVARVARLPHGSIDWRRGGAGLRKGQALTIRYRAGPERIAPAGRGVTKRLKPLFQEYGIPPWQRDTWPLLFDGDALVAVPGIAVAEGFAVDGGWRPQWTPR